MIAVVALGGFLAVLEPDEALSPSHHPASLTVAHR